MIRAPKICGGSHIRAGLSGYVARHDAAVRAHAILEGEDAAIIAGIRMAFADRIAWRIPHGRTLSLTWSREGSHLSLADAGEGPSQ